MIVVTLFFVYIVVAAIITGVLLNVVNDLTDLEKENILFIGFFWPLSIIGVILMIIIEITGKITRKVLKKWN